MKILGILIMALMFVYGFSYPVTYAEEPKLSGSATLDVVSNYVWRGQKLSHSWVIQPSIAIAYGGFGVGLWSNYDSDRSEASSGLETGHGEFTETDLTLSYSYTRDKLDVGAGYIYYALDGANDTQEVYLSASYETILNPTLTVYYDYDEGQGAFVVASIGHAFEASKNVQLNLGASASYNLNNKVMGTDIGGTRFSNLYNGELSSSLSLLVWRSITITPKVSYSFPLSNDAREAIRKISDAGEKNILFGGINLSLSF